MKRAIPTFVAFLLLVALGVNAHAQVWVRPYIDKDGTMVQGHWRSSPDANPHNNWSYQGNVNPYTGRVAPGNPETYLDRYYNNYYNSDRGYGGHREYPPRSRHRW